MSSITNEQLKSMEREREDSRALGIDLMKLEPLTPALRRRLFGLNNPNRDCANQRCPSNAMQENFRMGISK
jgi:hypothetical protein